MREKKFPGKRSPGKKSLEKITAQFTEGSLTIKKNFYCLIPPGDPTHTKRCASLPYNDPAYAKLRERACGDRVEYKIRNDQI